MWLGSAQGPVGGGFRGSGQRQGNDERVVLTKMIVRELGKLSGTGGRGVCFRGVELGRMSGNVIDRGWIDGRTGSCNRRVRVQERWACGDGDSRSIFRS